MGDAGSAAVRGDESCEDQASVDIA